MVARWALTVALQAVATALRAVAMARQRPPAEAEPALQGLMGAAEAPSQQASSLKAARRPAAGQLAVG